MKKFKIASCIAGSVLLVSIAMAGGFKGLISGSFTGTTNRFTYKSSSPAGISAVRLYPNVPAATSISFSNTGELSTTLNSVTNAPGATYTDGSCPYQLKQGGYIDMNSASPAVTTWYTIHLKAL